VERDIVTVRARINLASTDHEGILGMDLLREVVMKGEHAALTVGAEGPDQAAVLTELVEELRCDCLRTLRGALQRTGLR
jgi:hypothetical protein